MKKMLYVAVALIFAALFMVPASAAATEQDIINEIKAGVQVGSTVKEIPEKYVKLAEDFFAANSLTEAELQTALTDLKDAKDIWAASGKTEFKDIPASVQQQLQAKAAASAKKVGATLAFDGKTISIVDKSGKSFSVLAKTQPIKQTGADYTGAIVLCAAVLGTLTVLFLIARRYRLVGTRSV